MSAILRRVPAHILACHWDTDGLQWNCQKPGVVAICNLWLFGQTSLSTGLKQPFQHTFMTLSYSPDWWLVCAYLQQEQRGEESEFCPELATAGEWTLLSDTSVILSVLSSSSSSALANFLSDSTSLILLSLFLSCPGEWTVLWQQSWQLDPTMRIICA